MTSAGSLRVSHASGLHAVGRALDKMHHEMLRGGGELEGAGVRLAVLNLVAACVDVDSADVASQAVGRIGARHPARAIIIVANPDGPQQLEADLSLQCSAVDSAQVCAEQVRLAVGGEAAYHLASLVTPLLVPDIPVYLWLVGAPPLRQAFGQDAIAICERLIIDSGAYGDHAGTLRLLAHELETVGDALSLSDLAWERGRPWRQVLAQSFDGEEVRGFLRGITRVGIECSGYRVSAQAWLTAGWMASRLGWDDSHRSPEVATSCRHHNSIAEHDLARVELQCTSGDHAALITVEQRGDVLHSLIDIDGGIRAERAIPVAEPDTVRLVGSMLENDGDDRVYRAALQRAARFPLAS